MILRFPSLYKPGVLKSKSTIEFLSKLKYKIPNNNEPIDFQNQKNKSSNDRKKSIDHLIKKHQFRKEGLNFRQCKVLVFLKKYPEIDNSNYQLISGCIRRTASRDLSKLVNMGILERIGKGRGTYYIIKHRDKEKEDANRT